jgi:hypothetical protein
MTTTTPASITPILLSATPIPTVDGMRIDLEFNTAMAAGSGTIFITDGAVQTVIDRATGQPTMRVVGGTDTHTIVAGSVTIDGTHVTLIVPDLLPGHAYSVVMGEGVLASSAQVAFGGLRSTSQLQFSTPAAPDLEGPALVRGTIDAGLLKSDGTLHVMLTFSEPVSGLTADALSAPNATVSALVPAGDGRTWLATLTPSGAFEQAGNVLTIDMSRVHDAAGNAGKGSSNVLSYAVDTLAPAGVAITLENALLNTGGSVQVTFTFSEAVRDLPASAIQAPHAAIGNLATIDGGRTWTATLSALEPGTSSGNVISVDMSRLQDLNGNLGAGSFVSGASYAVDTVGPTVADIQLNGSLVSSNDSVEVVIRFSEKVSLSGDAINAPNARLQGLQGSADGMTWSAFLRAGSPVDASGNLLTIDMSRVHDAAGNAGSGSVPATQTYDVDTQAPAGAAITLDGALLHTGGSVQVTFTFSEAVRDLPSSTIHAPHAAIGNLATIDGGRTWTATLSAPEPGTSSGNVISVDMSGLQDLNGNLGAGSFVSGASYAVDTVGPTVADIQLNGSLVSSNDSVEVVIRFSEKVSLSGDAINAPNARLQGLQGSADGLTWTALLRPGSPLDAGGNLLTIDMSKVHDAAGNAGSGSVPATQTYDVDTVGPTASIVLDGTELRYGTDIGVTIKLSDYVTRDDLFNALAAQHASIDGLSATEDPLTWKATLKPGAGAAADTNGVTLDLSKLQDAHGNAGSGVATSSNYRVDTMVATYVDSAIRIQDGTGADKADNVTNDSSQTIFGTLSDKLKDGEHLHLTIKGTSTVEADVASDSRTWDFGGGEYHFADGVYTITAQVVDEGGHSGIAATRQITIDTAGPTLLTSPDGASGNPDDELVFTFDEAVYAIDRDSVSITITDAGGGKIGVYLNEDNFSADRKAITIPMSEHQLQAGKAYTIELSSSITDLAGNPIAHLAPLHFSTSGGDTLAPSATAAVSRTAPGIYGIGKEIDIAVSFSEAVRQAGSGTPVLHLNNGGIASWDRTSADGRTVIFKYVVGANGEQNALGPESLKLAGNTDLPGHVSDLAGNMLDQAHITFQNLDTSGTIQVFAHAPSAPGTPVLANDTGAVGDGITSAPVFTGSGTDGGATIKLFDGGTLIGSTVSSTGGNWTIGNLALQDGAHTLVARQYDGANNESAASAALTISVDSVAPNKPGMPILSTSSDSGASDHDGLTNDATPTLSGVATEAGGKIELYVNGSTTALAGTTVGAGGVWSLTVPDNLALADGTNTLTVRQVDAAGNRSASSDALAIQVKTSSAAPGKAVLDAASDSGSSSSDGITNIRAPKITGTAAESGATIKLYDGATLLGATTAGSDGKWSFTVGSQGGDPATLAEGAHTLTVRQVDAYGNLSAASTPLAITIDTVGPTIKSSKLDWSSNKHRYEVEFSEKIVFAADKVMDVLDALNLHGTHHAGNAGTNWQIEANDQGVESVLDLNLGALLGLFGHFHVKEDANAIQDVAGNAAVVGIPDFDIPHLL